MRRGCRPRDPSPPSDPSASEEALEQGAAEASASTEERLEEVLAEDVLDIRDVGEPRPVEALASPDLLLEAVRPVLVVNPTLLVVHEDLVERLEFFLDGPARGFGNRGAVLLQEFLRSIDELVRTVPQVDEFAPAAVLLGVGPGVPDRVVDLRALHALRGHDRQLLG